MKQILLIIIGICALSSWALVPGASTSNESLDPNEPTLTAPGAPVEAPASGYVPMNTEPYKGQPEVNDESDASTVLSNAPDPVNNNDGKEALIEVEKQIQSEKQRVWLWPLAAVVCVGVGLGASWGFAKYTNKLSAPYPQIAPETKSKKGPTIID